MHIRGIGEKAQQSHIRAIKDFASYLGRPPDTATPEELRSYQLHMTNAGVSPSTFNVRIVALRFFFGATGGREDMKRHMQFQRKPRPLPIVLSVEEVAELIHVDQGKGCKDRKAMLSPDLLDVLRDYWREARPHGRLFPGKPKVNPISPGLLTRTFTSAKRMAAFSKPATLHTLRHSFAYWNKKAVYGLLFRASAETLTTIASDPRHLGARIGMTSVLHTWGSALTHHPHVHIIVTGGGLSPDGTRWISRRPGFFLPVRVLSRLFRRLFLQGLMVLHRALYLVFFGDLAGLAEGDVFTAWLAPLRRAEWVVYAKPPFGGPKAVLAYLSRYTHRVAISNRRLISADARTVTFRWTDYRLKHRNGQKVMRLAVASSSAGS